jgi:tetratricopeptide (TPR) repeat protein
MSRAAFGTLLLLALLGAPRAGESASGTPRGDDVIRLLDATRMAEAEAALARVPPGDPLRPWAEALMQFHYGDYEAAFGALPEDAASAPAPGLAWLPTRILAARETTRDFLERREQNFVYRFAPGADAILVDYAIEALEGQRAAMARVVGVAPARPVVIEFFPSVPAFVAASGLPAEWVETTNTVAICKWDRMLVLSPMNMGRGYPWKDTIAHEYVHLVLSRASANRAPIWLQEGSAKVMESWWRKGPKPGRLELEPYSETLLAKGRDEGDLIPFADMHPSMAALPSAEAASLAFAEVATAVDFLLGELGEGGYRRIIEQTSLHGDAMRAVDEVMGLGGGGFEKRWLRWLGGQPLRARANIARLDEPLEAGAAGKSDTEDDELDAVLLAHRGMQDLTRVGDMLRQRGHLRAALVEYQKAAASEPFHSPKLANKQARTLAGLGELDFARDVLEESVALYPEFTPTVTLLSELAMQVGDTASAETHAWQAIGLNPFDPTPHVVLAQVYEAVGRAEEAQREKTVLSVLKTYGGW